MSRQTREEFMFGTEPITAWRVWKIMLPDAVDGGVDLSWRHEAMARRAYGERRRVLHGAARISEDEFDWYAYADLARDKAKEGQ